MYRAIRLICVLMLAGEACLAGSAIDLGSSSAVGINNSGQIVGYYYTGSGLTKHAFLYSGGNMTDLGTLPGDAISSALSINSSGQIVGWSAPANAENAQSGLPFHAFLYSGGLMMSLGTLGGNTSYAQAINNSGQIVGRSDTASGGSEAFLYSNGSMMDLGNLGRNSSSANSINASGQVVGSSEIADGSPHAFLYSGNRMIDLGTLGGFYSYALGINDSGQVVGYSYTTTGTEHPFLYNGASLIDLGTLGGATSSYALGINNIGQIVGSSYTASGVPHAFLYSGGNMIDLNSTVSLPSGVYLTYATAINDVGQIVAWGSDGHSYLLPTGVPVLSITKAHSGSFTPGQSGAVYTVQVSNSAGSSPTSGTVTVTDTLPAGLTLVSMSGNGWTCPGGPTCTRSDVLAGGASYPSIAVTVNVAPDAPSVVTNQVSVSGGGSTTANASDPTTIALHPTMSLSRSNLTFGAGCGAITGPQTVTVSFFGGANLSWTASSNQSNVMISPTSGSGLGTFQVSAYTGPNATIAVTTPGTPNFSLPVTVNIATATACNPFGSVDTPENNITGVAGAVAITGWALDPIEVTGVSIWREPVGAELPSYNGLIYIGNALFVAGARPDVQASYPAYPLNYRAGWGYSILTTGLPNNGGSPGAGNGTYRIHAIATNRTGSMMELGTKTITCDNAHATKPFGIIDTPSQGGDIVSGTLLNFGWALTQQPYMIPTDGSTIWVGVDGVLLGHPVYNQYRVDIATGFPGLANSNGAVGYFYLDTTTLSDGLHNIGWLVTDNAGRTDGVGSRFITVLNNRPDRGSQSGGDGPFASGRRTDETSGRYGHAFHGNRGTRAYRTPRWSDRRILDCQRRATSTSDWIDTEEGCLLLAGRPGIPW